MALLVTETTSDAVAGGTISRSHDDDTAAGMIVAKTPS